MFKTRSMIRTIFFFVIGLKLINPVFSQGIKNTIFSKVLNEERVYTVSLPFSYQDDLFNQEKYPVLILLDGDAHLFYVRSVLSFLASRGEIPEIIVVAISNTNRIRDLTPTHSLIDWKGNNSDNFSSSGGGDNFLKFLNQELLVEVDQNYRTMNLKILVGHSFGGLIGAHSFISNLGPFQAYILIDPSLWWDNNFMLKRLESNSFISTSRVKTCYVASANNSSSYIDTTTFRTSLLSFNNTLESKKSDSLRTKFQLFEEESHNSVPLIAFYHGIRFTFSGFNVPGNYYYEQDISDYKNHFDNFNKQWDLAFKPSEKEVNAIAYYHLRNENPKRALGFFQFNVECHPKSSNAFDSLAEWYLLNNDKVNAKKYYKKSLEYNPENQNAIDKIRELD